MNVEVLPLRELPAQWRNEWSRIQTENPKLQGPCLRPELFEAVGAFYPGVEVAAFSGGSSRAFLPFLRRGQTARPVPLCDYQAVVGPAGAAWPLREALAKARLASWDFEHLVTLEDWVVSETARGTLRPGVSNRIDLRPGVPAYLSEMDRRNVRFKHLAERRAALEKEAGPVRFVPLSGEASQLQLLLDWKAARFGRGSIVRPEMRGALSRLHSSSGGPMSGVLSLLFAGDTLAAAHFGVRCQGILHYWFPAFNPALSKHSPGSLLLQELILNLGQLQCGILDLGPGGESYKAHFGNNELPVAAGSVELPSPFTFAKTASRRLKNGLRSIRRLYNGLSGGDRA